VLRSTRASDLDAALGAALTVVTRPPGVPELTPGHLRDWATSLNLNLIGVSR
jgi:hypothetical protein